MTTCFDILARDIKDITQDEVDELLDELKARQRSFISQGLPPDEASVKASKSVQNDLKRAAMLEKRNAALNLRIRRAVLDEIETSFAGKPVEGAESVLVGSKYWRDGARYGVDQIQEALKRRYIGGFVGDLKRAELVKHFSDGNLDLDIAKALHDLDDTSKLSKLPPQAVEIAKIVRKWQEVTRYDANRAGASIGKLSDYIVTQSHDTDKLVAATFEKWYADILPRLDIDRMFPNAGLPDVRRYLDEAYKGIVSDIHEEIGGVEKMKAFTGPGNLAKRMSASRKLHFKSAEDWFEYNKEYGVGSLREAVSVGFERMAESTGLMRKLGTNPEQNLATIIDELKQKLRDSNDFTTLRKLDEWAQTRGAGLYSVVSGRARSVVNDSTAAVWSTVRGAQNITKLGGAVLSAISDPFIAANSVRHEGRNYFGALNEQLLSPIKAVLDKAGSGERSAALTELDYATDAEIGLLSSRFSQQERLPGVMTTLQRWAFTLNLLRPWTDIQRGAAVLGTSGHLAKLPESFSEINEQTRKMMANYGITAKHWPLLKQAVKTYGDYTIMSPQGVREMDSRAFASLTKDRINETKANTAERIVKRMKQDQREHDWVKNRAAKLREKMDAALKRLNEHHDKATGRSREIIEELQRRMSKLDEKIDYAEGWWLERVDRGQKVGFYGKGVLRKEGKTEGEALEAQKELRADIRQLTRDLEKFKKETGEEFVSHWESKQKDFLEFADGVDQRIKERAETTNRELIDLDPKIQRLLDDAKEDVATRLQSLIYDRMNYAVISPTARTEYFQTGGGKQRGTALGEGARTIMQFKSFSIAFWQNAIQQELYARGAGLGQRIGAREALGMAWLMASMTGIGYVSMTLKDWAKGKKARPVDNMRTWMSAAVQGGGAGLYGDYLFGERNRFGRSMWSSALGPTASDIEELGEIAISARDIVTADAELRDPGAKLLKFGVNHTPFVNLFYTKLAMEHLFLFQLQEELNPGYLRRMERRVERETGAEWHLRPTEAMQ
jgi:hypothetical protein